MVKHDSRKRWQPEYCVYTMSRSAISTIIFDKGEPVHIGRKSRIWTAPMARAIRARDKICVWPGCEQNRHLQIQHLLHWADGGATSVDNGACLCAFHHPMLHEGGYRIEWGGDNAQHQADQFEQQSVDARTGAWEVEQCLRNSTESFDAVRRVSPKRFWFQVIDSEGVMYLAENTLHV